MKKKTSVLVASLATIAMCTNLAVGATYALFTSESEVNIAVSSGKVDVKAGLANLQYQTLTVNTWTAATDNYTTFDGLGGSAKIEGGTLTLDKIVPGDAVKFDVKITNESTVNVKYRVLVENDEDKDLGLFDGLDVKVNDEEFDGEAIGKWTELAPTVADVETVSVEIALPNTGDPAIDNQYNGQNNSCEIVVSVQAVQGNAEVKDPADEWDGTADTSWYDENATEFALTSAEQLAGMNELIASGVTFEGKTIKLEGDMDMSGTEWVVSNSDFAGTFDGQGYTISNLARTVNTYERGGRMGLFGHVEGGTVKNVTLDSAAFYGYGPYGGVVAGSAYGECVFENITLTNCHNEMYNTGSAGIVGLAYSDSNYTFSGISIDSSNTIGSYWGSWDTPVGGLIGYFWKNGDTLSPVSVKDSYIAPVLNVYNDATGNNQWFEYRYAGMLIGYVNGSTTEIDGTTYPYANTVVCENVTVEYGDWVNYYYCELEANGKGSYSTEYKFSRLIPINSVEEIYNEEYDWDNHFVVVDENGNATCYHVTRDSETREVTGFHTHTEAESNNICQNLTFDQLFGGEPGVYGMPTHDGVTVIYNNPSKQASNE